MSREAREAAREKQRERLRGGEAVEQPEEDTSRRKHKVGVYVAARGLNFC